MAKGGGTAAVIALPLIVVGSLMAGILLIFGPAEEAGACAPGRVIDVGSVPAGPIEGYSGVQLTNAAYIMNAASALGMGRDAQIIGVMTAMGESSLQVLDNGDTAGPDSRGLFQQRDNGAWGSYSDRMDPTISATNFFKALQQVPNWASLPPTIAAHKVQGNADPYHYERYYPAAATVVGNLAGGGQAVCQGGNLAMPLNAGFQMTDDYGPRVAPVEGASGWHPAVDLQNWPNPCGQPVYAITTGTVTYKAGYQLSIKSPDGYTVSYLHMKLAEIVVNIGDSVVPAQVIGAVASEGPSTGCHLDVRINVVGNTNPAVAALPRSESIDGPAGWVSPEEFYAAYGIILCPPDSCRRTY
ncbi:M23 family metallopeptidase [Microbacterium sp. IO18]|uniref:M23 family metallopeptidase n=1 Tax=Microbacterium sp. IO18 TaxID=3390997 RepID=UPI003B9EB512